MFPGEKDSLTFVPELIPTLPDRGEQNEGTARKTTKGGIPSKKGGVQKKDSSVVLDSREVGGKKGS